MYMLWGIRPVVGDRSKIGRPSQSSETQCRGTGHCCRLGDVLDMCSSQKMTSMGGAFYLLFTCKCTKTDALIWSCLAAFLCQKKKKKSPPPVRHVHPVSTTLANSIPPPPALISSARQVCVGSIYWFFCVHCVWIKLPNLYIGFNDENCILIN